MKSMAVVFCLFITSLISFSQEVMTPELLWSLGRVSLVGLSNDGQEVIYTVTRYDLDQNSASTQTYQVPLDGGDAVAIDDAQSIYTSPAISPNGDWLIASEEVKIEPVSGVDFYPSLNKSNVKIYDDLTYRHWDEWEDGAYSHLFIRKVGDTADRGTDIMQGESYDCPMQPFGGAEDYTWSPDGSRVVYACKKQSGKEYALSTNSDLFAYDLATGQTTNLTASNKGYDTQPAFSMPGTLAWLQMDEPGYESDKNDLMIMENGSTINITAHWDGTVNSFAWSEDGQLIYFIAPIGGTVQLFSVKPDADSPITQITDGVFDVTSIGGQRGDILLVTRMDMNHATEIYTVDIRNGEMEQVTHVNDDVYSGIELSPVEERWIPTTDGKEMLTWVIYPPGFDPNGEYPALLYCQGGPQGALSQFYSFRWNFQLMAAQGYIVVAPNRRGMPGHGVEWNEQISGDWGGQNMQDYLSAIDALRAEPFVDEEKVGCVGASYGGYSAFFLAGMHEGRFKSFIAHDGVFNTISMYGTTEELFFPNKDWGGSYLTDPLPEAYTTFNPINYVEAWDTPMLIIQGGKDYRVPIGQGLEAYQAAQLKGLKSKLLYFPEENHWILTPQNGIVWQREFFEWLEETLK